MSEGYIQVDAYETTRFEDEWIVLNLDNFTVTKLNEAGGFCWALLQNPQTASSIRRALKDEFGDVSQSTEDELEKFLVNLLECGLVKNAG
jgi:hypothetical protein